MSRVLAVNDMEAQNFDISCLQFESHRDLSSSGVEWLDKMEHSIGGTVGEGFHK